MLVDLRGRISQRITAREDGVRGPSNYGPDNVFSTELSTARETPNHPLASRPGRCTEFRATFHAIPALVGTACNSVSAGQPVNRNR